MHAQPQIVIGYPQAGVPQFAAYGGFADVVKSWWSASGKQAVTNVVTSATQAGAAKVEEKLQQVKPVVPVSPPVATVPVQQKPGTFKDMIANLTGGLRPGGVSVAVTPDEITVSEPTFVQKYGTTLLVVAVVGGVVVAMKKRR